MNKNPRSQSKTKQSKAKQSKTKQSKAKQSKTKQNVLFFCAINIIHCILIDWIH
jgi:hypothetical protein